MARSYFSEIRHWATSKRGRKVSVTLTKQKRLRIQSAKYLYKIFSDNIYANSITFELVLYKFIIHMIRLAVIYLTLIEPLPLSRSVPHKHIYLKSNSLV